VRPCTSNGGVTTGASVKAALKAIDRSEPEWLVLAVPLAPPAVLLDLQAIADEVVCLSSPEPFLAVGNYYDDFTPTSDEEVIALMGAARARGIAPPATPAVANENGAPQPLPHPR
jgi:putative phosphoribosyl transferase